MEHPWEWDGLADVFGAGDEGDHPFDSDTKATVRDGTIFTQVQVEFVLGLVHFQGVHLGNEGIVVIFPHGTTDNFPITFWSQEVGTEDPVRIARDWLHIEGLKAGWVVDHEGWDTKVVGNPGFMRGAKVVPMFQMLVIGIRIIFMLLQEVNGIIVRNPFERLVDVALKQVYIPLQDFQSMRSLVQNALNQSLNIGFL